MRPETYVEAVHLLRFIYERKWGTHSRAEDRAKTVADARLAARYVQSKRHIPLDPDFKPE